MKKTAVQWLLEQYLKKDGLTKSDVKNATEMEKQQIIDAYEENMMSFTDGEKYYNEIFIKTEIE